VRETIRDRHVHLVLENEHNDAKRLARAHSGEPREHTAQWNDDVHHVLHVAATEERNGYYAEYAGDTDKLGRALAEGFAFQGELMRFSGRPRGAPSADIPPQAFVAFMQNHDQIGNRACGERIGMIAPPEAVRAIAAAYLLLPQVPMIFMGEEWNAAQPFVFFCDFSGDLARAVSEGRRNEFAAFPEFQDPQKRAAIPDPQSPDTFASAKLRWDEMREPKHAEWLDWYRRVLRVRKDEIVPLASRLRGGGCYEILGPGAVRVRWNAGDVSLVLDANLSAQSVAVEPLENVREIWREGAQRDGTLAPWSVTYWIAR
jgi:maltooligosyltrehalose trehalohydrolase